MFRGPYGGRSKATPSTTCQKCLKKGHYSYECTVSAQERPYKSRPSRTQQLLNPNLKPKLTTEVPNELLRKKGVADELLAKKEEERGRKASRDRGNKSRKRSRSVSSHSSDSVSTISTNRSPSRSRSPKRSERNGKPTMRGGRGEDTLGKRGRSISSESDSSRHSYDRNTRRRMSSFSPAQRGRRGRSGSNRMDMPNDHGSRRGGGRRRQSRSRSLHRKRPLRSPSLSRSRSRSSGRMDIDRNPHRNGTSKEHVIPTQQPSHTRRHMPDSRSRSRSRGRVPRRSPLRSARSPSPFARRAPPRSPSPFTAQNGGRGRQFVGGRDQEQVTKNGPPAPRPQKERSLSPFSKRVALTRAMQAGR